MLRSSLSYRSIELIKLLTEWSMSSIYQHIWYLVCSHYSDEDDSDDHDDKNGDDDHSDGDNSDDKDGNGGDSNDDGGGCLSYIHVSSYHTYHMSISN